MAYRNIEMLKHIAAPYLKPEHATWLYNNHTNDADSMAAASIEAARSHPEVTAARNGNENAFKRVLGQKAAEHFGSSIEAYMTREPERQRQERVKDAISRVNAMPITKKPNGKFVLGCYKCEGTGIVSRHSDVDNGRCYDCRGKGYSDKSTEYDSAEELHTKLMNSAVAKANKDPEIQPKPTVPEAPVAPQEKPKGFTNKYAGNCVGCGTRVGPGEGLTSRGASGWEVRCVGCHHG